MVQKLTRILTVTLILALCVAVIYLNPEHTTMHYGPASSITAMSGVVYLGCFALGVGISLFFWVLYGIRVYFRERALLSKGQQSRQFYESLLEARGLLASKEFVRAKDRWQKLIKRDPTDIIARVELSRSLEQAGEKKEALKILDKARAADPTNVEVLLRAADLNLSLGNKTAAVDNLALVLYHHPNAYAAGLARELSEQLGRTEDALEYNEQYETLSGGRDREVFARLQYEKLRIELEDKDRKGRISLLRKFVQQNRFFTQAAIDLALLYFEKANTFSNGIDILTASAKESLGSDTPREALVVWRQMVSVIMDHSSDDEAFAMIERAAQDIGVFGKSNGNARTEGVKLDIRLDIAQAQLANEDADDALTSLNALKEQIASVSCPHVASSSSASSDSSNSPGDSQKKGRCPYVSGRMEDLRNERRGMRYLALKGSTLSALGQHEEAEQIWSKLTSCQSFLPGSLSGNKKKSPELELKSGKNGTAKQPSPELSTP